MIAREEYRLMRVHMVAAMEIQRVYRGHIGRKKALRRKEWENAEPGPERLKLGLKLIEESKIAFERQQEEIDAVTNAMVSSRRFQDELNKPGASVSSVMDKLNLKHATAKDFERILGIPWPILSVGSPLMLFGYLLR